MKPMSAMNARMTYRIALLPLFILLCSQLCLLFLIFLVQLRISRIRRRRMLRSREIIRMDYRMGRIIVFWVRCRRLGARLSCATI